jgi:hypothetical protein
MNKMTPCAQKGYANGRYCQEVLMGVIDTIETCKAKKIKGGLLSLDIQKAFDSLSHSYSYTLKNNAPVHFLIPIVGIFLTEQETSQLSFSFLVLPQVTYSASLHIIQLDSKYVVLHTVLQP